MDGLSKDKKTAYLLLVVLWLVWGNFWVVSKNALPVMGGAWMLSLLKIAGGVVVLFIALFIKRKSLSMTPPPFLPTLLYGLTQTTGFTALTVFALTHGGAGKVSVLAYSMPIWVIILNTLVLKQKLAISQAIKLSIPIIGFVIVVAPWSINESKQVISSVMALLCGLSWGISVLILKWILKKNPTVNVLNLTAWQMLYGLIPLIALAWYMPHPPIVFNQTFILSFLYIAIVVSALGWFCWAAIASKLPANIASINSLAAPAVAMMSGMIFLGNMLSATDLLGVTLIFGGIIIIFATSKKKSNKVSTAVASSQKS
ncbi:DMT family transporter [Edwardsiella piscicida]|uniref:DMT family transporter n=1 Tax=Edwardsiella piscicida TaxID=1263550 RepID=UPI00093316FA|nr:DMT family transporter [Edwardsiella piscicida]